MLRPARLNRRMSLTEGPASLEDEPEEALPDASEMRAGNRYGWCVGLGTEWANPDAAPEIALEEVLRSHAIYTGERRVNVETLVVASNRAWEAFINSRQRRRQRSG